MRNKKRFTTLLLALAMVAGMSACQPADTSANTDGETQADTVVTVLTTEAETEPTVSPEEARLNQLFETKTTLRFNESGEFRILVLSDLHMPAGGIPEEGLARVRQLVETEKPDLIILDGDNVVDGSISSESVFQESLDPLANYFKEQNIYWMHVYGNHDPEMGVSLAQQQAIYESYEHCLSKDPDKEITGVGNYVIPIYGSEGDEVKFVVWGIDSNSSLSAEDRQAMFPLGSTSFKGYSNTGYDYIHYDQIEWYREASELIEAQCGHKIPGLMAFHIPLQEFYTAWMNRRVMEWTGDKGEDVCASAYNSGLFEVLRGRGDVKAVVSGHDHVNDYMVDYGGIKLCYSSTASTTTYGGTGGARVFVIRESDPANVETYISYLFKTE